MIISQLSCDVRGWGDIIVQLTKKSNKIEKEHGKAFLGRHCDGINVSMTRRVMNYNIPLWNVIETSEGTKSGNCKICEMSFFSPFFSSSFSSFFPKNFQNWIFLIYPIRWCKRSYIAFDWVKTLIISAIPHISLFTLVLLPRINSFQHSPSTNFLYLLFSSII